MKVLIVESPAKAKTINKYLGSGYKVLASYGHIRDLPSKDGSVDTANDFAVTYVVDKDAVKNVKAIADAMKGADTLLLATDPDREGEAISWHVAEVLKEKKILKGITVKRVVFNEITKTAIQAAVENPREIDMDLVNAQQARRVLDYLVGFNLSPVLWRKLPGSRSAGRVQSVALRLICERETEIEKFNSQEYWDIKVDFTKNSGEKFEATLTQVKGERLEKFSIPNEAKATEIAGNLKGKNYSIREIENKQVRRNPYAPFTTSTLQQEASKKLGYGAKRTMQIAQQLYEGVDIGSETVGLITYMRTDGVTVAKEAIFSARDVIEKKFGKQYVPDSPRMYQTKSKNAQEAHEAIRPTDISRTPEMVKKYLREEMFDLYELIWKRMVASQMASAVLDQVLVDIETEDKYALLRASGSTVRFPGFFAVYRERDEDVKNDDDDEKNIPDLKEGEKVNAEKISPDQHFTEPPPRYSEASLVKKLEELGIGRPSTYASIITILQDREYVRLDKKRFIPEERGRLVTAFLENFFNRYVQYDFTAKLEDELDMISAGEINWKEVLRKFWVDFHENVESTSKLEFTKVVEAIDNVMGEHFFPASAGADARKCPKCENGRLGIKLSKFGAFIGCSNYPECNYTRNMEVKGEGEEGAAPAGERVEDRIIGQDEDGKNIYVKVGPYGPYIQVGEPEKKLKPKRVALPKNVKHEDVDMALAKSILTLPREVGKHPESGKAIKAGIGRFGPYIEHDKKFKSLKGDDDVLTIGINRAVALLAEESGKGGRGGGAKAAALKTFEHPDGGEISVLDGRYGAYVKYGKINATLPKGTEPTAITLEEALELLSKKAGAPAKGKRKKK